MAVWSLTPFFNEVDVFEIRLAELDDVVDVHVVAESPLTYSGDPKPLFFQRALHEGRFDRWRHKIRHVLVHDAPAGKDGMRPGKHFQPHGGMAWRRENHQRDALLRGCEGMGANDIVLLSDADEIPSAACLRAGFDGAGWDLERAICRIYLPQHVMFLNWRWSELYTIAVCRVTDGWNIMSRGPERVRKDQSGLINADLGGWHFSYMGGPDAISYKIRSAAHEELDTPLWTDPLRIRDRIDRRGDMFGRDYRRPAPVPLSSLPLHVRENVHRFEHMLDLSP